MSQITPVISSGADCLQPKQNTGNAAVYLSRVVTSIRFSKSIQLLSLYTPDSLLLLKAGLLKAGLDDLRVLFEPE